MGAGRGGCCGRALLKCLGGREPPPWRNLPAPARAEPPMTSACNRLHSKALGGRPAKPPKLPCPEPLGLMSKPVTTSNGIEFTRLQAPVCKRDRSDPALASFPKCTRVTAGCVVSHTEIPVLPPPMAPPRSRAAGSGPAACQGGAEPGAGRDLQAHGSPGQVFCCSRLWRHCAVWEGAGDSVIIACECKSHSLQEFWDISCSVSSATPL